MLKRVDKKQQFLQATAIVEYLKTKNVKVVYHSCLLKLNERVLSKSRLFDDTIVGYIVNKKWNHFCSLIAICVSTKYF